MWALAQRALQLLFTEEGQEGVQAFAGSGRERMGKVEAGRARAGGERGALREEEKAAGAGSGDHREGVLRGEGREVRMRDGQQRPVEQSDGREHLLSLNQAGDEEKKRLRLTLNQAGDEEPYAQRLVSGMLWPLARLRQPLGRQWLAWIELRLLPRMSSLSTMHIM